MLTDVGDSQSGEFCINGGRWEGWRLIGLARWLYDEFGVSLTETAVGRELKKLGYVKLTARPRYPSQSEYAMEGFKKGALQLSWQR